MKSYDKEKLFEFLDFGSELVAKLLKQESHFFDSLIKM